MCFASKGSIDHDCDLPKTAVVHDGVVVVTHLTGVSKGATPAVTVVCTIRFTGFITLWNSRADLAIWAEPGILEVITHYWILKKNEITHWNHS